MNQTQPFSLALFSVEPNFIQKATQAGIDVIIVDWENKDKETRQAGADTQINYNTPLDLVRVRAATIKTVICRINAFNPATTRNELEIAIDYGTDEVLLPMVRTVQEVETVLHWSNQKCKVGILVETDSAIQIAFELGKLPIARSYIGLNDLSIDRKTPSIFTALLDGTLDQIRHHFQIPFGFGGITIPDRGYPIPCRLLLAEMARLECDFSFLRRSFHKDIQGRSVEREIPRIREAIEKAQRRSREQILLDKRDLDQAIAGLSVLAGKSTGEA